MSSATELACLGGGQLGRMLALAGADLGVGVRVFDEDDGACAGQVARLTVGRFGDTSAVREFVRGAGGATFEFENVPSGAALAAGEVTRLAPGVRALEIAQDRVAEKRFFNGLGIPTARWKEAGSEAELRDALRGVGLPAIVKTRRMGYDGKGQAVVRSAEEMARVWGAFGASAMSHGGLIVEEMVGFAREVSVIAARGWDGEMRVWPLTENVHGGGILRASAALTHVGEEEWHEARGIAEMVLKELEYVGVLAIEMFEAVPPEQESSRSARPRLLVNEMACRVHNSGHWTIEGAETSQFENHVRACLGWPLGSTRARGASVMVNLIGDVPLGEGLRALMRVEGAHVHLYGKAGRAGRKVGHVTVRRERFEEAKAGAMDVARVVGAEEWVRKLRG